MQEVPVTARLFPAVLSGDKTVTIRWREPRIVTGPMTYVCEGTGRRAVVEVIRVTDVPLRAAADLVGRADVWPPRIMLAGMQAHYPRITLDDVVQVIEHLPCRGDADPRLEGDGVQPRR
ncbi:ASCH domain-containing protein [Acidimangrovimonas sediminis]|uniref:ASCH domain-containing protein n=1 Tax=Acidimangrovimonas sediminis TaxID=2056283 RepID=UPI000C80C38A|nr:ASCH domain-containing protein [Acidimangrovimonas sediminis]